MVRVVVPPLVHLVENQIAGLSVIVTDRSSLTRVVLLPLTAPVASWTRPWTIHMPYHMDKSYVIYEYACHEGNYMMTDALTGARDLEKQGKATRVDRGTVGSPGPSPADTIFSPAIAT